LYQIYSNFQYEDHKIILILYFFNRIRLQEDFFWLSVCKKENFLKVA